MVMRLPWVLLFSFLCQGAAFALETPVPWSAGDPALRRTASIMPLPFAFYSQFFQWTGGIYVQTIDLVQPDTHFDIVVFGSSNGTRYFYHQMRRFRVPGVPRLYVEPTVYYGHFGEIRAYTDMPSARRFPEDVGARFPGHNGSDSGHYLTLSGSDQWYRVNLRWLLPWGDGRQARFSWPLLKNGRLQAHAAGGHGVSPLTSGRTFLEIEPYYRKQVGTVIAGATLALTRENWDLEENPSRGSYQRVAIQHNWATLGSSAPWTLVELDLRWYLPLSPAGAPNYSVLAFNLWTMNCLSWNASHLEGDASAGQRVVQHRPPAFAAPALGSDERFRAYYQNRFNDRAMAYVGGEWRRTLGWNPLRRLQVHWLQVVAFAEAGRVAPQWGWDRFSRHPKLSGGGGMRAMCTDQVLRLDIATGSEGTMVQMFMDQAF